MLGLAASKQALRWNSQEAEEREVEAQLATVNGREDEGDRLQLVTVGDSHKTERDGETSYGPKPPTG